MSKGKLTSIEDMIIGEKCKIELNSFYEEITIKNIDIKTFGELFVNVEGNKTLLIIGDNLDIRSGAKVVNL